MLALCAAAGAAEIRGTVVDALQGKPLKRAEVVLRPTSGVRPAAGVVTGAEGQFGFFDLPPDTYTLTVSRTGYLPSNAAFQGSVRLAAPLAVDRNLSGIVVRLHRAAALAGTVFHPDGERAAGITVEAYREYFRRNRHGYEVAGRAQTDDRGRYRLFGLPPGDYYVAAVVLPFSGSRDVEEQWGRDAFGRSVPPERPVPTFLPSGWRASDATQLTLEAGDEIESADIFLSVARTYSVSGRVLHGGTGAPLEGMAVTLFREDITGSGYLPAHAISGPVLRGGFTIRGVTPGSYMLEVRASDRNRFLFARRSILVGEAPVSVEMIAQPETDFRGQVYSTDRNRNIPPGLRVSVEPRHGELPSRTAAVQEDGTFSIPMIPGETYDVMLSAPGSTYLQSAAFDTIDVIARGLTAPANTVVPLVLTVDDRGASVRGETQPGAVVALLPDTQSPLHYDETEASEWGVFSFSGVAPGKYRVVAWYDAPPCDFWNPNRRSECSRFGRAISVEPGSGLTLTVEP